jgi:hypothetical protein
MLLLKTLVMHSPVRVLLSATHNSSNRVQPWPVRLVFSVTQISAPSAFVRFSASPDTRRKVEPLGPWGAGTMAGPVLSGTPFRVADSLGPGTSHSGCTLI